MSIEAIFEIICQKPGLKIKAPTTEPEKITPGIKTEHFSTIFRIYSDHLGIIGKTSVIEE